MVGRVTSSGCTVTIVVGSAIEVGESVLAAAGAREGVALESDRTSFQKRHVIQAVMRKIASISHFANPPNAMERASKPRGAISTDTGTSIAPPLVDTCTLPV